MALSPDGTQLAVSLINSDGMSSDFWILDLRRGTKIRLTSGLGIKREPVWQSDGQFLLFANAFSGGSAHIERVKGDGTGTRETFLQSDGLFDIPGSVCREGNYLAFSRYPKESPNLQAVWILPLAGDRKPFPLIHSQFANGWPVFSPDCKWIAYISSETGQREIYVTHFPDATRRYRVSTQGGTQARWRGDGKELFYLSGNSVMAVDVDEKADSISLGTPRTLFSAANYGGVNVTSFEVTADGQRFLMTEPNSPKSPVPLTLVTNWNAELKTR